MRRGPQRRRRSSPGWPCSGPRALWPVPCASCSPTCGAAGSGMPLCRWRTPLSPPGWPAIPSAGRYGCAAPTGWTAPSLTVCSAPSSSCPKRWTGATCPGWPSCSPTRWPTYAGLTPSPSSCWRPPPVCTGSIPWCGWCWSWPTGIWSSPATRPWCASTARRPAPHPLDGPALGRGRSGLCPVLPAPPPAGPQGVECLSAGGGPLCHRLAGRPSHPPEGTGALLRPGGQPPHLRSAPPRHPPAQNAGPERRVPAGLRAHPRDGPHTPV